MRTKLSILCEGIRTQYIESPSSIESAFLITKEIYDRFQTNNSEFEDLETILLYWKCFVVRSIFTKLNDQLQNYKCYDPTTYSDFNTSSSQITNKPNPTINNPLFSVLDIFQVDDLGDINIKSEIEKDPVLTQAEKEYLKLKYLI